MTENCKKTKDIRTLKSKKTSTKQPSIPMLRIPVGVRRDNGLEQLFNK